MPSFVFASIFNIFDLDKIIIAISEFLKALASMLFWISALIFDNLLQISLSTSLLEESFIKVAWSNIRDLANIGFILGIIYIAFSMLANYGNWQRSLIYIILIIFVINFSLFFSRVIVDAGNITAHIFLSAVGTTINSGKKGSEDDYFFFARKVTKNENAEYKSVGASLVRGLQVKNLLGEENFTKWRDGSLQEEQSYYKYVALNLMLVILYIMLAKRFLKAGFMFLGRLIWIVYYMISSPIFFITLLIPGQDKVLKSQWLIPILTKSFCIVVYLFFIWLIYIVLNSGIGEISLENASFLGTVSIFAIKAIFIYVLLGQAESFGTKMCEDGESTFGKIIGGLGSVTGRAGRLARGSLNFIPGGSILNKVSSRLVQSGRKVGGKLGKHITNSGAKLHDIKFGFKDQVLMREKKPKAI